MMYLKLWATKSNKEFDCVVESSKNVQVICEMTNGGVDYSFDCTGDVGVIYSALESATPVS
jgi:threonine dehydrogenase-like Zn-dependent dehydrogenase